VTRPIGHAVIPLAVLSAAAAGGCSSDAGLPDFVAQMPLVWVDPARCLTDCAHVSQPALVEIDAAGLATAGGGQWILKEAQPALAAMLWAAAGATFTVTVGGAHRTYDVQAMLWDQNSVSEPGRAARPGHSEHEAGLAVDLAFAADADAAWIAANAWRFGFVMSYPQHKQKVTGFRYEPWHFRFVGSATAAQLHDRGNPPLEELFKSQPTLGISGDCGDCPLESSRSDCTDLTAAGTCDGTVLRWCFDGAAAAVDCTTSGLVCSVEPSSTIADCVDP